MIAVWTLLNMQVRYETCDKCQKLIFELSPADFGPLTALNLHIGLNRASACGNVWKLEPVCRLNPGELKDRNFPSKGIGL